METTPPPSPPIQQKRFAKFLNIFTWIKSHKKATLVIISLLFLFAVIFTIVFQIFKDKFSLFLPPQQNEISQNRNNQSDAGTGSLEVKTDKDNYKVGEVVTLRVFADSKGKPVRGFDVQVSFDPEFLSITEKVTPSLTQFDLFVENDSNRFTVSGIQKEAISEDQIFTNTALFRYQFKIKKTGKTQINLVQAANSTNESNLIDKDSQDLLSDIYGKEIEIR